ncbi:hypothetical protein ACFL4Y_01915 [Gemmatimonadota bacterium]
MIDEAYHPPLPDQYTEDWEQRVVADLSFAPAAENLLVNGRVEDARRLCEAGVVAHPYYATGHLLLGQAYLAESKWDEARLELERALQLDGTYPTTLEALAACYEQLGLTDLARGCRALGRDLDPRPPAPEEEGGPEMVDDSQQRSDEGQEPESSAQPSDEGMGLEGLDASEEALRELEALLDSAGSSSGEEETPEVAEEEPVAEEPVEIGAIDLGVEAEKEPAADEPVEIGAIDLGVEAEEEPAAEEPVEIARIDLGVEAEEEPTVAEPVEIGAIDLDAGAGPAGEAPEEDPEKADLWKKILEQAESLDSEDVAEEAPVEELETAPEVASVEGLEVSEAGALEVDAGTLEGLEVVTPGGDLADPETAEQMADALEAGEPETVDSTGMELSAASPEETEAHLEEMQKELGGDLEQFETVELDESALDGLEILQDEDSLAAQKEPEAPAAEEPEVQPAGVADLDLEAAASPDEVLAELESELSGEVAEPVAGTGDDVPSPLDAALADLETGGSAEPEEETSPEAMEDLEPVDVEPSIEIEEDALEAVPEMEEVPASPQRGGGEHDFTTADAATSSDQIQTAEDSIRFAIKADILIAQGKIKEALRLYEALHLWEPDRPSFKQRVEELRRGGELPGAD